MKNVEHFFGELASTDGTRRAEYSKRRKSYTEQSFPYALQEEREAEGWVTARENAKSVRMRIPKSIDEVLENRFWNVLYNLGYKDLNVGRTFKIHIPESGLHKQIDVFAKDDETVIVAECKASEILTKRSLQKDIGEFASLQKAIATSVKKHYGSSFKPKILWFFVTDKIRWTENDLQRAKSNNIHVIQSRELLYFEEISKKLGAAARYQFHAEFLAQQKVPALTNRSVPAVRTKIGGKTAYFFSARPIDVLRIAFVNHRDLRDPTGAPSYQRLVNPNRLKKIGLFLDDGGFFPNTILLNFHRKPRFDKQTKDELSGVQFGTLSLPDRYKSCWVIDGQHRLYGTSFAKGHGNEAPLFFIAFENVSKAEEANTFVTINETQTKVPKKLLIELDGELKWDSKDPKEKLGAIASRAVDLLNISGSGPFEGKVSTPGVSVNTEQPLTLPNFQQAILQSKLIGSVNKRTKEFIAGPCWEKDSETSLVRTVELLSLYFEQVEQVAPIRWESGKSAYLCSNFGIYGHVRLLGELLRFSAHVENFDPAQLELSEISKTLEPYIEPVLKFIKNSDDESFAKRFKVPFGSGGQVRYFFKLVELVREKYPNFEPDGFEDFIQTVSVEGVQRADEIVKTIQKVVPEFVVGELKKKYGSSFFDEAVPKQIQKACHDKRIDDDAQPQLPVETYLDWLQIRKIVEQKNVRELFASSLSIQLEGEGKGRHFYAAWFDQINEIRRISAHPAGRQYKEDDLEFLDFIFAQLKEKLPSQYFLGGVYAAVS